MLGDIIGGIGSLVGGYFQSKGAQKNIEQQRLFARSGIQWRVEDAKKAGIHPLYALGANTTSFSPVPVGDMGMAAAGQHLGRAINTTMSPTQRLTEFQQTSQSLQLKNMDLQNQLLSSQIARLNQTPNPALPSANQRWLVDGQGQTALSDDSRSGVPGTLISESPLKRVTSDPAALHQEPGAISDLGFARTATGYVPVPSKDVKERIEDMTIPEVMWAMRNNILPSVQFNQNPPFPAPEGKEWIFNPLKQEYQLIPGGGSVYRRLFDRGRR